MSNFECSYCNEPAVFTINGRGGCQKHIEQAVSGAVAPIKKALEVLGDD